MTVSEIIFSSGLGIILLLSLIEIAPLKINPWKALGKAIGRAINGEVLIQLGSVRDDVKSLRTEVNDMQNDINLVKEDLGSVQADVTKLTSELEVVKQNINNVQDDVLRVDFEVKKNEIIMARSRILRFGDEVFHGIDHTEEHYKQILIDIDKYNAYCNEHSEFENSITLINSKKIKDEYMRRVETNGFL